MSIRATPTLVTAPPVEPVTLAEAKAHLRVDGNDRDPVIDRLIAAARQAVESGEPWSLNRSLITTTGRVALDGFAGVRDPIELPRPNLLSVVSVKYDDSAGVEQTLAPSLYRVITDGAPGRVACAINQQWPITSGEPSSVRITYTAGYGATAASVPACVKQAMLLLIGDMHEHGESILTGTISSVLPTLRSLLASEQWCYR